MAVPQARGSWSWWWWAPPATPPVRPFWQAAQRAFIPYGVRAHRPGDVPASLPLLQGKTLVGDRPALYICRNRACDAPITEPREALESLQRLAAHRA